jgi:hypothetical protein
VQRNEAQRAVYRGVISLDSSLKKLDTQGLERIMEIFNMKGLQAKLKAEGKLTLAGYQELRETFRTILKDQFQELSGLEPNYKLVLKDKIDTIVKDLSVYGATIPAISSIKKSIRKDAPLEHLINSYDDLKSAQDILLSKKPLKIKSCLKKLKAMNNDQLAKEIATLLCTYYLEHSQPLTSYSSDLLDPNPIKRLTVISKLLSGGEDPTSSPLPKPTVLRSMMETAQSKGQAISLDRCVRFCKPSSQAAKLVGGLITSNQMEGIGKFSDLKPSEVLELLLKRRGPKATVVSRIDFTGYSTRVIDLAASGLEENKNEGMEIDEEELKSMFPGRYFTNLINSCHKDRHGNLVLSEKDIKELYSLWNRSDKSRKILTNPFNVLHACLQHPDKDSLFCSKYSLLLSLWLNSFFPSTVSLNPVPNSEDLLDYLQEQFDSIENIFESFSFWFDSNDVPAEYYVAFSLDELIINRERIASLLPDHVKEIIVAVAAHATQSKITENRFLILERKVIEGQLKVSLNSEEASLLHSLMDSFHIVDSQFFDQFDRSHGASGQYCFEASKGDELSRLILQVKALCLMHKGAQFDAMDPLDVLTCLQFVQTLDGGAKIMQFVAQRLADSEKYGEFFCDMLAQSKSVAEAVHKYTVYIDDLITGSHRPVALVTVASQADPQLNDLIREREDSMSAEEILEYLEKMHPYKMEAILSQYYLDFDSEKLSFPRKSHTRSTLIHY